MHSAPEIVAEYGVGRMRGLQPGAVSSISTEARGRSIAAEADRDGPEPE